MQIVRTIVWVAIVFALGLFAAFNWEQVNIKLWENLVLETKLPMLILTAFLLGLVPMWLIHRTTKWRLKRRIASLETAQRTLIDNQEAERRETVQATEQEPSVP